MSLIAWCVLGLIIGFAGSRFAYKTREGLPLDIVVGVAGAVVGGLVCNAVQPSTASVMNLWGLSIAAIGSVLVVWVWHAFVRDA